MADCITDTKLAAVLRSGLDGAQDITPSSLPRLHDECAVSPALAQIDAHFQTTPVMVTEQAGLRT